MFKVTFIYFTLLKQECKNVKLDLILHVFILQFPHSVILDCLYFIQVQISFI